MGMGRLISPGVIAVTMGVSGAAAQTSLEAQVQSLLDHVRGSRLGVITNPTGVDGALGQIADRLHAGASAEVVAFFAPEHGLRGDRQAGVSVPDYIDPATGIPVHSLYGSRLAPTAAQLANVDVLVFDIQDVGARHYTYVWTMTHCMEAAAAQGIPFVVFDRPNPAGADRAEGAPNPADYGLIGRKWPGQPFGVSTRHGMTPGELARLVNGAWMSPQADLTVIAIPGYTRQTRWEELGRQWVAPSPNIPTVDTAFAYLATCIFEQTNVSEGRGTTRPFELIGAPFIDSLVWASDLNALDLPGVRFRAASFIPTFSRYANQVCNGVQLHVLDREAFDPFLTGLWMLKTLRTRHPVDFVINANADRLSGVPGLANAVATMTPEEIIAGWQADLTAFRALRAQYLIYPVAPGNSGLVLRPE